MKKTLRTFVIAAVLSLASYGVFAQGSWAPLKNLAPAPEGGGMVLLTDGTVMCKTYSSGG